MPKVIINVPIFNMKLNSKLLSWIHKYELIDVRDFLLVFLKSPLNSIKSVPTWPWPTLLIVSAGLSAVSSILNGVVSARYLWIIASLVIAPIGFVSVVGVLSGFFYYTFYFFFNRELPFKQIFAILVVVSIPNLAAYIIESKVPPISILGFAASCMLLIVGFVENFHLPRKPITRLIAIVFAVYLGSWIFQVVEFTKIQEKFSKPNSSQNIDILEREIKGQ